MTKADEFKAKRQADYASVHELFDIVLGADPDAKVFMLDDRAVIQFSDGSRYTLGNNG